MEYVQVPAVWTSFRALISAGANDFRQRQELKHMER